MRRSELLLSCFIFITIFFAIGSVYAAIYTVTNLNDSGNGSLRWAIGQANTNPGPDTIDFGVSGTIFPTSGLSGITDNGTMLDASSQWIGTWPGGQPGITLDGSSAGESEGLVLEGAINNINNCYIRGLFITNFGVNGIAIRGEPMSGHSNIIGGTSAGQRNVISGNGDYGVVISNADNNVVSGNYIGTDVAGTTALGNSSRGVGIWNRSQSNIIGGISDGERNVISGNKGNGVAIWGAGTDNNVVSGNYIGTDVTGMVALGNSGGVSIWGGTQSNIIGGTSDGERNIIAGNGRHGIAIWYSGTDNNVVSGNYIGTDITGTTDLGNSLCGILISGRAQLNVIGGTTAGERNIISGNNSYGVEIANPGTNGNIVSGNYIGTDATGTADLGNSWSGVVIWGEAQSNIIGGTTAGERNIISGNDRRGVGIWHLGTINNVVSGNYIGTNVSGTSRLGNSSCGVEITHGAQLNIIGGATAGERNVISGNGCGVGLSHRGTDGNIISGNYIGADYTGTVALGNSTGISIWVGPQSNIIGGITTGERNIISGNDGHGVNIQDLGTNNNVVSGNYIGTDVNGIADLGNSGCGVVIWREARSNAIGGTTAGERNIISGNDSCGIDIQGSGTNGNVVSGNYIGTDVTGTAGIGNSTDGVSIDGGAQSNIIGGGTEHERNIISGNGRHGVAIENLGTYNSIVSGNYIGADANGIAGLGNAGDGVLVSHDTNPVIERNIIGDNVNGVGCYNNASPDLGGGGTIPNGLNEIYNNQSYDVYNGTANTIMAEYNWWGTRRPDPSQFYGNVDYDPWLRCPVGVALLSDLSELDTLAAFRDNVLTQNKTGQYIIDAYYKHTPELVQILLRNPSLCLRSAAILKQIMRGIQFLLDDSTGRDIVMSRLLLIRIQKLFADISAQSSDELADTLSMLSEMLDDCKGMRVSRIWRSMERKQLMRR